METADKHLSTGEKDVSLPTRLFIQEMRLEFEDSFNCKCYIGVVLGI
ncbi:hypothetical protein P872_10245 [Rhodonellum psychrophilum GCM71 = DSM 17998]|uniref:Uncharacterized protein n=1 Tax=Rhodonellum psychrophilum GCM71 = DSM 17998 TaxID=1123057 RepID=U5BXY8_9BACT|nr:hypothetical protein P872_10245 [Rhodonellum psychrophilum GCM71 = DSM 17998]